MAELVPRSIFLSGDRQPSVTFYTSSRAKFAQAEAMFSAAGLRLGFKAHDSEPYDEDYGGTKEELLSKAVTQVRRRHGGSTYFFLEDTSIRLEALSGDVDVPGLAAKEWFAATDFETLQGLIGLEGDRGCVVKSCIALALPGHAEPVFFYGETRGFVIPELRPAKLDLEYPWLDPRSFSAWFIPAGADRTLAEMSFEESLQHDFRARSLTSLIDRLEEYSIALNVGTAAYSLRWRPKREQEPLFEIASAAVGTQLPLTLVVGPTCSGKTTFGMQVQFEAGMRFVDASSIVKMLRGEQERDGEFIGDFAASLLEDAGPDVVARYIAANIIENSAEPCIVTGLRAIEEIQFFRSTFPNVQVVSLEAPQRVRYLRYVRRNSREVRSESTFAEVDEQQSRLGLLRVANELADLVVANRYSSEEFISQIRKAIGIGGHDARGVRRVKTRLNPRVSQLYRCLIVLRRAGVPLTTQELEGQFGGGSIRYNNANKILKRYPELARRQESLGSNVRYQITNAGLAFIRAIDDLHRLPGE